MANFVNKLKRGTCKYKGKIPLKCFSCGKIGNFVEKIPFRMMMNLILRKSQSKVDTQRRKAFSPRLDMIHLKMTRKT